MARSAQARFDNASRLSELDEKPTMERARRAGLRRHERSMDDAYKAGRDTGRSRARSRGAVSLVAPGTLPVAYPNEEDADHQAAFEQGAEEAIAQERRSAAGKVGADAANRAKKRTVGPVKEGSGFLLGLLAYALFLAYMRDGVDGPKNWLKAKFLNDTPSTKQAPKTTKPTPATPTPAPTPTARIPYTTVAYVPSSQLPKAGPG